MQKPRHTVVEIPIPIIVIKYCQIICVQVSKDLAASEGYKQMDIKKSSSSNSASCTLNVFVAKNVISLKHPVLSWTEQRSTGRM